ncbi:hypothetical protein TWF191_003323 [Orbilia oligospora]|uniref:Uncharacterized protein n=1 Tax=Orbilia oligospora TaxID=2813651 RepID=A0A7C8UTR5_ORBOL|nr:hypothetical protein TWF191_003323 [Orbilia oligospora]
MAAVASSPPLATLLSTLTTSLTSTANSLPSAPPQSTSTESEKDGDTVINGGQDVDTTGAEDLLSTLATLRLWLEKGIKPCENKLKYQIEKALKAASEWEREKVRLEKEKEELEEDEDEDDDDEEDGEGSDDGDDDNDEDEEIDSDEEITSESDSELPKTLNYDSDDLSSKPRSKSKSTPATATLKNALSYRPNPSSLAKPASASLPSKNMDSSAKEGVYRPPKLNPVVMPSAPSTHELNNDPDAKQRGGEGRKQKARVIDEYLASMPGAAPVAEPSIGSNVGRLGRTKTARERDEERERRDYEESNFVRLPGMTKKEKKEKARRDAGRGREWGGEDWGSLEKGMGLDRIERLTKRKDGGGMLARSRKRGADIEGEARIGERFEKRRKVVDRDRRRRG